jgi:hypothetical protein
MPEGAGHRGGAGQRRRRPTARARHRLRARRRLLDGKLPRPGAGASPPRAGPPPGARTAPWTRSPRRRWPSRTSSPSRPCRQVDACLAHDTADRLRSIAAPTLVISDGLDAILPPRFGRSVAGLIPGARLEVMAEESTSLPGGDRRLERSRRCLLARGPTASPETPRHAKCWVCRSPERPASRPGRRTPYRLLASEAVSARVVILS